MCTDDEFTAIDLSQNTSMQCSDEHENITAFIEENLGDSHVNWATLIPLTIIYSIFLVVGISGNLATCIVIISNEYMRTATNVYLLNLAIADIATLVLSKYMKLFYVTVEFVLYTKFLKFIDLYLCKHLWSFACVES